MLLGNILLVIESLIFIGKKTRGSCTCSRQWSEGDGALLQSSLPSSSTRQPRHVKEGGKGVKKSLYSYFTLLAKEKHQHMLFTCRYQRIQGFCSVIEMSQLKMLSFLLTQLSAAISALVRGTGRCQMWKQPCQRDSERATIFWACSFIPQ